MVINFCYDFYKSHSVTIDPNFKVIKVNFIVEQYMPMNSLKILELVG
jgi:hypothetical protein